MMDTNVHFGENTKENELTLFFNDYVIMIIIATIFVLLIILPIIIWIKDKKEDENDNNDEPISFWDLGKL